MSERREVRPSYAHRGGERPLLGVPIGAYLHEVAARQPHHEAVVVVEQGVRLGYGELFELSGRLARGLLALGVARGDRVGIWATDSVEWLALQLATAEIGAVLVNVNPANRRAELEHALRAARVGTLFLMPSFRRSRYADTVVELCPEIANCDPGRLAAAALPELREVVLFDPRRFDLARPQASSRPARGFRLWPEVLELGAAVDPARLAERAAELDADDPINIQFTSGTTGFPKPVVLTHHNLLNNAFFGAEAMALTPVDRLCVPVPFYHCFGMVLSNLACLSHGATIVVPAPHFDAAATLAAVERERCTALHGVPTMFVAELELPEFDNYDLGSLRTGIMAGAPCPPELLEKVIGRMGCGEILIAYGQTEASPATHITRRGDSFERRTRTVGVNLPHQEVKIVDPATGATVALGRQGEICFRGYHVMRGYFEQPEATREAIDGAGWLHSGDLGSMDEEGYVRITGRLKEMVIRGGENIYPAEIEAYLGRHPKVAQVAVFGFADSRLGEELGAWVQLHAGAEADPEELRAFVAEGMAHYKVPRLVWIVDEFPLTVTGKIQKFRMRERVERELRRSA